MKVETLKMDNKGREEFFKNMLILFNIVFWFFFLQIFVWSEPIIIIIYYLFIYYFQSAFPPHQKHNEFGVCLSCTLNDRFALCLACNGPKSLGLKVTGVVIWCHVVSG